VLGNKVTVLASKAVTQSYEITLQPGDEGMGPPLHSHNWDESVYVLKGKVEFSCAGKTVICMPGTLVHVPAGTVHGNYAMVEDCWCWWYRKYVPGNAELKKLESEAREAQRGLWADPHPVPPWEWWKAKEGA